MRYQTKAMAPVHYPSLKKLRRQKVIAFIAKFFASFLMVVFMLAMTLAWMLDDPAAVLDLGFSAKEQMIDKPIEMIQAHPATHGKGKK